MSDSFTTTEMLPSRKVLQFISDFTGPATLFIFGIVLWGSGASENLFSFAAWGTLDILFGFSVYKAGAKKESLLPFIYGATCIFVVVMIYRNGQWHWAEAETFCAIGTAIGIFCWWRFGPIAAVIAFGAALFVASIPILISTYHNPQTWEWWLWIGCGISASTGLYLTKPWRLANIQRWLFVGISEVVTVIMLTFLLWPLLK